MIALHDVIRSGFPNDKCNLPLPLRPFWCVRSLPPNDKNDDIMVMGSRVVIPESIRREVFRNFLLIHQGATKLRQRAHQTMYWPSMECEFITAARACHTCAEYLPSHPPEPFLLRQKASRQYEFVHAGLGCHNGRDFLILADQFIGWWHGHTSSHFQTKTPLHARWLTLSSPFSPLVRVHQSNFGRKVEPSLLLTNVSPSFVIGASATALPLYYTLNLTALWKCP